MPSQILAFTVSSSSASALLSGRLVPVTEDDTFRSMASAPNR